MNEPRPSNFFLLPNEYSEEAFNIIRNAFSYLEKLNSKNVRLSQQIYLHFNNIPGNRGLRLDYKYDIINKKTSYIITEIIMTGKTRESKFVNKQKAKYILDIHEYGEVIKNYSLYKKEKMIEDIRIHLYRSDTIEFILS